MTRFVFVLSVSYAYFCFILNPIFLYLLKPKLVLHEPAFCEIRVCGCLRHNCIRVKQRDCRTLTIIVTDGWLNDRCARRRSGEQRTAIRSKSQQLNMIHYDDFIMGAMASHFTSLTIVYSTFYSGADQRKHQSSMSLVFVQGIHRKPANSPHKWPVTRKMFPFDDVIMRRRSWFMPWHYYTNLVLISIQTGWKMKFRVEFMQSLFWVILQRTEQIKNKWVWEKIDKNMFRENIIFLVFVNTNC